MAVENNLNRNTSYVSCIVIKGRPVLPPVITSKISVELLRFKTLALEVEKKIREKKQGIDVTGRNYSHLIINPTNQAVEKRSDAVESQNFENIRAENRSNVVDDYELKYLSFDNEKEQYMLSNKCWSEFNFLKCDTSTPPSVASTDLAKYMTALSDKDDQSLLLELNSSVTSNGECVAADLPETSNSEMSASLTSPYRERPVTSSETTIVSGQNDIQGFNSYSSYSSRHFRRASYTLENPSPVLVAKMQKLQLENPEDQNTMHIPNTRLSNLDVVKNFNTGGLLSRCSTKVMTFEDLNMPSWEQSDVHTDITTSSKQSRNVDEHKLENGPRENWQQEINHLLAQPIKTTFDKLSAAVKGYLTRRLMRTHKVQSIIATIKDTLEFALQLHTESPLQNLQVSLQDAELHKRLFVQLTNACCEFHDIFFQLTTKERMELISQDRQLSNKKSAQEAQKHQKALSSATLKSIERKRCKSMQSSNQTPSSFKRYCQIQRKKTPMDSLRMISGSRNTVRPHTASPVLQHALEHYSSESKHLVTSRYLHKKHDLCGNNQHPLLKFKRKTSIWKSRLRVRGSP